MTGKSKFLKRLSCDMRLKIANRKGFTLFEMILAAAIFVLLAGGVYFAVSASVKATARLGDDQIDARRSAAFQSFVRRGFHNLPFEARIFVRVRQLGARGQSVELLLSPAAGAFETGFEADGVGVVLGTRPDGHGKSDLCLARFPERYDHDELDRYLEKVGWIPLLHNVESIRWRFWDDMRKQFIDTWDQGTTRPRLVELTYRLVGGEDTLCVFSLSRLRAESTTSEELLQP